MSKATIELVIFDLGRVMIQLVAGWEDACARAGVPAPPAAKDPDIWQKMVHVSYRHERGEIDHDTFAQQTAKLCDLPAAEVSKVSHTWLQGAFPGTSDLVDDLASGGIAMACLSNTNDGHWAAMHGDGPNRLPMHQFDHHFASHLIGVMKPDPAIYEHVERETGLPGESIVFFDDSPPNVEAARSRGWRAFDITADELPADQMRKHLTTLGVIPRAW